MKDADVDITDTVDEPTAASPTSPQTAGDWRRENLRGDAFAILAVLVLYALIATGVALFGYSALMLWGLIGTTLAFIALIALTKG